MEYKAVQFEVVQTPDLGCWKRTVFLNSTRRSGIALTRADAIVDTERALEKASEPRNGDSGSCSDAGD